MADSAMMASNVAGTCPGCLSDLAGLAQQRYGVCCAGSCCLVNLLADREN